MAAADFRPLAPLQRTQSLLHVCFSGYLQEESIRGELSVKRQLGADEAAAMESPLILSRAKQAATRSSGLADRSAAI